ncbi:MAG: DNA internalization-related competence protein ComEC/Rec2 [Bellilinea sp.]|nr:MAG: DNA internalization-related competence protein ComEC/Rec2 [Bellilinea sp.]
MPPLLWLSAAFLIGIGLSTVLRLPSAFWLAAAAVSAGLVFVENRLSRRFTALTGLYRFLPLPAGVILSILLLGAWRWQIAQPHFTPAHLAFYNDLGKAELTGWIASDPDRRENAVLLTVQVETIRLQGTTSPHQVNNRALVRLPAGGEWSYGQYVRIWGSPQTPPEDETFSYRAYLARRGIFTYLIYPAVEIIPGETGSPLLKAIYALRRLAYQTLNRLYPQPEAALLSGILLGLEHDLPADLARAFQDTGTAHIIAISGFNMTVLSGLFLALFGRFLPRLWAAVSAILAVTFYTLLVGANPAVVRAAVMSSLALFGRLIGRRSAGLTPLTFSAAVMTAFNPWLPWDASFQLSFTATLGLILYADPLQHTLEGWLTNRFSPGLAQRIAPPVSEYFLLTLAAQLTTLPIVLAQFGRLSLSALLANPLILPVQPLAMQLSGLALIAGMLWLPAGQVLGWLTYPFSAFTIRLVELLSNLPGGTLDFGAAGWGTAIGLYVLLFGLTAWVRIQPSYPNRWIGWLRAALKPSLVLGGLGVLTLLVWGAALRRADGNLHVIVPNFSDGQVVLLRTPGGRQVLVGSAAHANALAGTLGRETSLFSRRLDVVVLPFQRASLLEGMPAALERLPCRSLYWAVEPTASRSASRLHQTLSLTHTPQQRLAARDRLQLDHDLILHVVQSDGEKAALLIEYRNTRLLMPNGFSPADLLSAGAPVSGATLLLGSLDQKETPLDEWRSLNPSVILLQSGEDEGTGVISTARYGRVEWISDGSAIWLQSAQH